MSHLLLGYVSPEKLDLYNGLLHSRGYIHLSHTLQFLHIPNLTTLYIAAGNILSLIRFITLLHLLLEQHPVASHPSIVHTISYISFSESTNLIYLLISSSTASTNDLSQNNRGPFPTLSSLTALNMSIP